MRGVTSPHFFQRLVKLINTLTSHNIEDLLDINEHYNLQMFTECCNTIMQVFAVVMTYKDFEHTTPATRLSLLSAYAPSVQRLLYMACNCRPIVSTNKEADVHVLRIVNAVSNDWKKLDTVRRAVAKFMCQLQDRCDQRVRHRKSLKSAFKGSKRSVKCVLTR